MDHSSRATKPKSRISGKLHPPDDTSKGFGWSCKKQVLSKLEHSFAKGVWGTEMQAAGCEMYSKVQSTSHVEDSPNTFDTYACDVFYRFCCLLQ